MFDLQTCEASRSATSSPALGCGATRFAEPDGQMTDLFGPVPVLANLSARQAKELRLHGFGLKTTALANPLIVSMLETADSMAWSFHARINGRNANDWREAKAWAENITNRPMQHLLDLLSIGVPV